MNVVGTITATTTKNNADTAVPFSLPTRYFIQVSADGYYKLGTASTVTATAADTKLLADAIVEIDPPNHLYIYIAYLPAAGASSTLKVLQR